MTTFTSEDRENAMKEPVVIVDSGASVDAKKMNANELADTLIKMFTGEEYDRLIHEIPNMLRQQQSEIKLLKEHGYKAWYEKLSLENHNLKTELENLKKAQEK
jgi:hypothetical protein